MKYLGYMFFPLRRLAVVLFLAIFLAACGSGGGGGGGSSSSSSNSGALQPVAYVGNLNGAVITDANAKTLSSAAMTDHGVVYGGQVVSGAVSMTAPVSGKPLITKMANALQESLLSVNSSSSSISGVSLQGNIDKTVDCASGGTVTISITDPSVTGDFTGSIRYSACSDTDTGESLSGNIAVEGHMLQTDVGQLLGTLISAGTLNFTRPSESYTLTGRLTTQYQYDTSSIIPIPTNISVTANTVDIRNDNVNGEYLRLKSFMVETVIAAAYIDMSFTGTLCHSVAGCVTAETLAAFRFNNHTDSTDLNSPPDPAPSLGQLKITGMATLIDPNTTYYSAARLTAVDNTSYNLEWDTNGDGTYEGSLLSQLWSNF